MIDHEYFQEQIKSLPVLLPCPFCGGNPVFKAANFIHCENVVECGGQVELGDHGPKTAEFAVESWNRRIKGETTSSKLTTPKQFKEKMQQIVKKEDNPEIIHSQMDFLLCEVLTELGYGEGIHIFDQQEMWYA